ncbi:hypothetical protein AX16_005664 [Volvariella volvacea WC 439]|nr:hypothetical protein AX16_005664 [Volvariella volvacea WC 439]
MFNLNRLVAFFVLFVASAAALPVAEPISDEVLPRGGGGADWRRGSGSADWRRGSGSADWKRGSGSADWRRENPLVD